MTTAPNPGGMDVTATEPHAAFDITATEMTTAPEPHAAFDITATEMTTAPDPMRPST